MCQVLSFYSASCKIEKKFFFLNDTCIIPPSKLEYPRGMKTAVIPNNPLRCHHVMNAAPGRTLTETPFLHAQRRGGREKAFIHRALAVF